MKKHSPLHWQQDNRHAIGRKVHDGYLLDLVTVRPGGYFVERTDWHPTRKSVEISARMWVRGVRQNPRSYERENDGDVPYQVECDVCGESYTGYMPPELEWMLDDPLAANVCPECKDRARRKNPLYSAYGMHKKHPDTFELPDTKGVKAGDLVKVAGYKKGVTAGERFWVKVTSVKGDRFTGVVDNDASAVGYPYGKKISFSRSNIYDVWR